MLGPISFKLALFAVNIVEMIKKVIEFGFRPSGAREVRPRLELASNVELEICRGPIGHRRGVRSADHVIARRQR